MKNTPFSKSHTPFSAVFYSNLFNGIQWRRRCTTACYSIHIVMFARVEDNLSVYTALRDGHACHCLLSPGFPAWGIPPNAGLVFQIRVLDIKQGRQQEL